MQATAAVGDRCYTVNVGELVWVWRGQQRAAPLRLAANRPRRRSVSAPGMPLDLHAHRGNVSATIDLSVFDLEWYVCGLCGVNMVCQH